jgi:hypothetical protein
MAHYFIAYLKTLVFHAEPFAAFGTAHSFTPVEKSGQNDDKED